MIKSHGNWLPRRAFRRPSAPDLACVYVVVYLLYDSSLVLRTSLFWLCNPHGWYECQVSRSGSSLVSYVTHLLFFLSSSPSRIPASSSEGPGPGPRAGPEPPPGPRTPLGAAPLAPGPGPSRARSRAPGPCPCPGPGPGLGARAPGSGCLLIASTSPRIRDQSTQRDHGFRTHLRYKGVHSFAGLLKKQCVPVAACIQCANKYNWRDHHRQFRPDCFLG